jgi:outer membrane protein insertion porin family
MVWRIWSPRRRARELSAHAFAASAPCISILLALVITATAAFDCAAAAPSEPAIVVEGNRRIDADAIRAHFHPAPDAQLDAAALDAALKELYATGAFEDVKIARSGGHVVVTVVEAPLIGRLQFEGNKKLKDADLEKAIELKPSSPLTRAAVQGDVARLAEFYRHSGRYAVAITPKTIARGDGRVDLLFEINEGAKTGVKRIAFIGSHAFSDQRLKAVIATTESGWFGFLKTSDVYDPDRVEADRELIRRFYAKNGFADVRVASAIGTYDAAQQGVVLSFTLEEGDRYRFGAIDVESHIAELDVATLRGLLRIGSGDVYDGDAVEKAVGELAIAAGKRGHPFVSVRAHTHRNVQGKTIDLAFALDDGPHRYIERIVVRGNAATREQVIRREFDVAEGDAFNPALIERAERRLKALAMFKSVKISSERGSATDRVVLNVDVEEQRTGAFSVSGGYSTADGFLGEVSVSEQNFLGRGQYVKVAATLGQYVRGGSLSVVEPYLLGSRASLGLDLSYRESLTNANQSYGSTTYGASIKADAPLTDNISAEARYSIVRQSLSLSPALMDCSPTNPPPGCYANGEASAPVKQAVLNGPTWTSAVGSTVAYSSLDNPRNPHDGLRAELRQDVAGLGGGVDFLRSTGDVRYYKSLGDEVVGIARVQGGTIAPYGGQTLPVTSSFFGGPQLVRGFAPNGFGPRDVTAGTTMDNIGGSSYWATSAQLQAPIPGLPPEVALKGAFFADAGSLWGYRGPTSFPALSQSLNVADSRQVRSSVGASLIWDSPFGALHVDYAIPTSKTKYDITQRLGFGAGGF